MRTTFSKLVIGHLFRKQATCSTAHRGQPTSGEREQASNRIRVLEAKVPVLVLGDLDKSLPLSQDLSYSLYIRA